MLGDFGDVSVLLPIKARCVAEAILKDEFPQQLLLGLSEFENRKHSNSQFLKTKALPDQQKWCKSCFFFVRDLMKLWARMVAFQAQMTRA